MWIVGLYASGGNDERKAEQIINEARGRLKALGWDVKTSQRVHQEPVIPLVQRPRETVGG